MALERHGADATLLAIPRGPYVIPYVRRGVTAVAVAEAKRISMLAGREIIGDFLTFSYALRLILAVEHAILAPRGSEGLKD